MPTIVSNAEDYFSEAWWIALDEAISDGSAPEELRVLASDEYADVSRERLELVLEFARSLPGWEDGSEDVPHPFSIVED